MSKTGRTEDERAGGSRKVTRRRVLAGAISMSVLPAAVPRPSQADADVLDVLVVGGGVSGCYAAARIASASPRGRIET